MPPGHMRRINNHEDPEKYGIPVKVILWTLDQISEMLSVPQDRLEKEYVFYEGRSIGSRARDKMLARNIAPQGSTPEWRVAEREVIRWARVKGFRVYERGWVTY